MGYMSKHASPRNPLQLGIVMRGLGQNPTEQELKEIIADVDLDADGLVRFDVSANLHAKRAPTPLLTAP